jgi:hypothetical protein
MISRSQTTKPFPIDIAGSSTFGRYPKISEQTTINMFISDNFLIPYSGYQSQKQGGLMASLGTVGRGIHTSTKLNRLVVVVDQNVYLINLFFDQALSKSRDAQVVKIGTLLTTTGVVYITENNKPQILISDGQFLYLYDPLSSPVFSMPTINFVPGYVDFHDTYFLAAASQDATYNPPANNTWRLSQSNDGSSWPSSALNSPNVGLLQTKPDNTQAVVRFPSRGNLVLVMGRTVTEPWYDNGLQQFPYQRNTSWSVDYGCLNPATIATMDELVVWLAANEKSGPVIMYTNGGDPHKITTDGIDYLFAQLTNPADSRAFLYQQDGHLFYHINFYTDNLSLFYDFNTNKFFNASDENGNYFIADQVAFFNNQYYFITRNNGNLYAFDTIYTTYDGAEIPRVRICRNVRLPSQEYFIANDAGFTIESGETPFQQEQIDVFVLITQDGHPIITQGNAIFWISQDNKFVVSQDNNDLIFQQTDSTDFFFLIAQQVEYGYFPPRVDLSISIDGGATFGSDMPYNLSALGHRKNRLMWWQLGLANDMVLQFRFWGLGRFVATDGLLNIRQ